ncbi:Two component transcriptional regulator, AraC family [Thermobacillus xylanilyticus]|jgi:two-component system, response regulator YesN|uniref:Two component transcriptional regulator, AraC family n=2 Tax=Thermobacillus xylanilyticus TaxID=76633 RepID=A0ABM8V6T0_THEXY|nr:Two component transcriptional regulator, AraC family [Thermobacillus xylanilyticus]
MMAYSVLLVDDEPHALEGLQLMVDWERFGFRVAGTCRDGEEAMLRIRIDPPDLVVTDIRMPVMDGLALIEEAQRAGHRDLLFVIASGYHDFEYAARAVRLGVSHYLTKPVIPSEAEEMLGRLAAELRERERADLASDDIEPPEASHAPETGGIQAEVAEYLRAHYRRSLTIREIAERFYVHPVYLGQSFARKYGIGILDYVHELRIEEAKRLLESTDMTLGAIAESVGYNAYQYFLKQFERRTGMKPAAYRLRASGKTKTDSTS